MTAFSELAGCPDWGGPDGRIVYGTADNSNYRYIAQNSEGRIAMPSLPSQDIYTIDPDGTCLEILGVHATHPRVARTS